MPSSPRSSCDTSSPSPALQSFENTGPEARPGWRPSFVSYGFVLTADAHSNCRCSQTCRDVSPANRVPRRTLDKTWGGSVLTFRVRRLLDEEVTDGAFGGR